MIDVAAAALHGSVRNPYTPMAVDDHMRYIEDSQSSGEQGTERHAVQRAQPWRAYEKIKIAEVEELTDHQYLLMYPCLPGYALGQKDWSKPALATNIQCCWTTTRLLTDFF